MMEDDDDGYRQRRAYYYNKKPIRWIQANNNACRNTGLEELEAIRQDL